MSKKGIYASQKMVHFVAVRSGFKVFASMINLIWIAIEHRYMQQM